MPGHYFHRLFGQNARRMQQLAGSRDIYAVREHGRHGEMDPLTDREIAFISARDSFYMASVTQSGWPYVQHRGGAPGFIKQVGTNRLGFIDYAGNRQFISAGNILSNGRVSLFFMDYPARRRLKLVGQATVADLSVAPELLEGTSGEQGERAFLIDVVGFDWNCPKFITQRFTLEELQQERQISTTRLKEPKND